MAGKRTIRLILALVSPLAVDCGAGGPLSSSKLPDKVPASCAVDLKSPDAIMKANLGLEGQLEERVKAALAAGARLEELGTKIEDEVSTACSNLARDLGATEDGILPKKDGPGKKAEAACSAAAKMIKKAKKKLGAEARLEVETEPPKCEASVDDVVDCAAECDANIKQADLKAECQGGEIQGKCDGKCEGTCITKAGAKCEGDCSGSCNGKCDGDVKGKCDGKCTGKCDGKDSKAKCAGVCEGKCAGDAQASCSGKCNGTCSASCEMKGQADCSGSCSGGCSVAVKEPRCNGTIRPPDMSKECQANCGAKLMSELKCKPAKVTVKASGGGDAQAVAKLKRALETNLPVLIKVNLRMKDSLGELTDNAQSSLKGVQSAVTSGGAAALKVGGCIASSLKTQVDATASINLSVKASASASAAAGTD